MRYRSFEIGKDMSVKIWVMVFSVFITGSNVLLLSKELGTSLTGRHITM